MGRTLADFSTGRANLFYDLTKFLEKYVGQSSGVAEEWADEYMVDGDVFVAFFNKFWRTGLLSDVYGSFVTSWAEWAAGIVDNITLQPHEWRDRQGDILVVKRYKLEDEHEKVLEERRAAGAITTVEAGNDAQNKSV